MGKQIERSGVLVATLDSHGGDRQREDRELWEELKDRVRELTEEPRYERLKIIIA